jgi:hypothetical protein
MRKDSCSWSKSYPRTEALERAAPCLFRPMYAFAKIGHPSREEGLVLCSNRSAAEIRATRSPVGTTEVNWRQSQAPPDPGVLGPPEPRTMPRVFQSSLRDRSLSHANSRLRSGLSSSSLRTRPRDGSSCATLHRQFATAFAATLIHRNGYG